MSVGEYEIVSKDSAIISNLSNLCYHFVVPSIFIPKANKKYKIIGFSKPKKEFDIQYMRLFTVVSFDESSEIEVVPVSFIQKCKITFVLPPRIKRVIGDGGTTFKGPDIAYNKNNPFVSVSGQKSIINHHPFELLFQHSLRHYLNIRETVRIIGVGAYYKNKAVTHVVFPSSVEVIDGYSLYECKSLKKVVFKRNSKLRKIGKCAFCETSIKSFHCPPLVDDIGDCAFRRCRKLSDFTFSKDSRVRNIGNSAFCKSNVKSIEFPSSLERIETYAFVLCRKLSSISFPKDSKLKVIGNQSFSGAIIASLEIPASVERIGDFAFSECLNLSTVSFLGDKRGVLIGNCAFSNCPYND